MAQEILICTTPIRPVPTAYPPFGSLAVIQYLREHGYDPYFFDIDGLRPSWDDVIRIFEKRRPKIIGISAVVSTAYAYTRKLSWMIKEVLPDSYVVVGGNLAASAELLLRRCGVDVCVTGEGEIPFLKLVIYLSDVRGAPGGIKGIRGLVFLDDQGEVRFTGYERQIPASDLSDPDYSILEQYSRIDNYIIDPWRHYSQKEVELETDFMRDPRFDEPHRRGKRVGTVVSAKGCVARCTFCHRWERGFRQLPVRKVIGRIKYLADCYNVGFVRFGDENFGSDRRAVEELLPALQELDILWAVSGMRARTADRDLLKRMRKAGCVAVYYGIESGSQRMLDIMEKNTTVEQNLRALEWTQEAGLYTAIQLVLGMPGEDRTTIAETTAFLQEAMSQYPDHPADHLSINYAQALPGTPLYEYTRLIGLAARTLEEEEAYLLQISDTNAADDTKIINFPGQPMVEVITWRPRLILETMQHWYSQGTGHSLAVPELGAGRVFFLGVTRVLSRFLPVGRRGSREAGRTKEDDYNRGGYFNIHRSILHGRLSRRAYRLREPLLLGWAVWRLLWTQPFPRACAAVWEWLVWWFRGGPAGFPGKGESLRRTVQRLTTAPTKVSEESTLR